MGSSRYAMSSALPSQNTTTTAVNTLVLMSARWKSWSPSARWKLSRPTQVMRVGLTSMKASAKAITTGTRKNATNSSVWGATKTAPQTPVRPRAPEPRPRGERSEERRVGKEYNRERMQNEEYEMSRK